LDAGTVAPTTASINYEITISQSLTVGFYWLAMCQQGTAPTTGAYYGGSTSTTALNSYVNGQLSPSTQGVMGYFQASVTGAFANAGTLSATTTCIYTWVRAV
jgi:hypothetical protein